MTETLLHKEFGPSYRKLFFLMLLGLPFLIGGIWAIDFNASFDSQKILYGAITMGGLAILPLTICLITGRPKIILTPDGIENQSFLRTKKHAWRDVGVFAMQTQRINYNTMRYLCAYTDVNHDALHHNNFTTSATAYNADISIQIQYLKAGRKDASAQGMAREFNKWRLKYGAPENNAYHFTEEQKQTLRKQKKRKNYVGFTIIILGLALYAVAKFYR